MISAEQVLEKHASEKQISEKQLAANRRNAQLSRGPVSAAGRQRSSLNNLRHGLTGQTTVLSDEDRAAHERLCAGIVACLRPVGLLEAQMAQSIADDHWRLNRVSAIETNMFALGHYESPAQEDASEDDPDIHAALNSARVFLADAKQFALLSIYEQRIHRNLQKSMAELRELQATRRSMPAPDAVAQNEAADATRQPKPASPSTIVPPENGFVFANDRNPAATAHGPDRNPAQSAEILAPAATASGVGVPYCSPGI
ncbi:MAG TPA: hypothetical protein VHY84_22330 [Bryobacteraceae bacterium]|jgi:hypothetical protein|nr:hypothetical protein [Bryobacteraceae bacterium]